MDGGWGDANDTAAYLDISPSVTRRAIRRGDLAAFRVGGRKLVRLKREHCDAYMLAQAVAVPVKVKR
jgi:excisionase family DNA binding protein